VQGLFVHQHGNTEPRLLDRPFLRGIDVFGRLAGGAQDFFWRTFAVGWTRDHADTV